MSDTIKSETAFSNEDIVRFLLEETNTTEPPTNAEKIARYLKLTVRGFFHHEYKLDPKIRAYLHPTRREIGISRNLSHHRRKFSILHEVGHYVIPGHLDKEELDKEDIIVDDDRTLADYSVIKQEMEANQFAADCLFQLARFSDDVRSQNLDWNNIKLLSSIYDTSLIACARRWVEESHKDYALLVFTPTSLRSMSPLRLSYTITSNSFKQRYFARIPRIWMKKESRVFQVFHKTGQYADWNAKLSIEIDSDVQSFDVLLFPTLYGVYGLIDQS